jgi:DNA helicase-2/ATP-dependent DNA helicase PcrA
MGALFDGFEERQGSVAAIHCRRGVCDQLAKSTKGAYQAIEEIAAKRLQQFAREWDDAASPKDKVNALRSLVADTTTSKKLEDGAVDTGEDLAAGGRARAALTALEASGNPADAVKYIEEVRRHSRARTFRGELLKDAARAMREVEAGRFDCFRDAATAVRQRVSTSGREIQKRMVSTPLLLKGLEFDHVVIPDAAHFMSESTAAAKLFYVAISRARTSLTISSSSRYLTFPVPNT